MSLETETEGSASSSGPPLVVRSGKLLGDPGEEFDAAVERHFSQVFCMVQPALYHQGISHSLGFAVLVSFLLAFFYGGGRATWSLGGLFFLAYGSHLFIDVLGPDT